ncbi:L-fuculokinase [Capnocytophaga stomatis]|uniref:L-fuculokinase n=1 Tax=Capnocytophaga stomatis TaxID=1848904 RepID=A0A250FV83_9FLAO|nr:L-fuculokinase [Capnocytophaga stomatis]ATA89003.1 L-fuculokinase [Capnocytophaga stomatis]
MNPLAIIFDCGATNVRVVAINMQGEIEALQSYPNQTETDPNYPEGRIWDFDAIWNKLLRACKSVTSQIDPNRIVGVTTTTFGVDGAFVDAEGKLLYPIISWQCPRTIPILDNISKYLPVDELYTESGVFPYNFNTINKLIWFKENRPEIIDQTEVFLFMPSLLNMRLTGAKCNDNTMMGTSMLTSVASQNFSEKIFEKLQISPAIFGKVGASGDVVGKVTSSASKETGLPEGTPVYLAGHDTQFAIIGSGADINQPVLSSGTWEILMTRSEKATSTPRELDLGITTEFDAEKGKYNIGVNYIASGMLEWIKRNFYGSLSGSECYETMIREASQIPQGVEGVKLNPDFYATQGASGGSIEGLTLHTTRGHIYRAALEALAFKLKEALNSVEKAGNFKAESIICVGGGSKNALWNQIRADVCGIPVKVIEQKETTVLGASFYVFTSAGFFKSIKEAQQTIKESNIFYPNK